MKSDSGIRIASAAPVRKVIRKKDMNTIRTMTPISMPGVKARFAFCAFSASREYSGMDFAPSCCDISLRSWAITSSRV